MLVNAIRTRDNCKQVHDVWVVAIRQGGVHEVLGIRLGDSERRYRELDDVSGSAKDELSEGSPSKFKAAEVSAAAAPGSERGRRRKRPCLATAKMID